jgi:predicted dithiol-disulfide oxidoreductase (DUF899 family)
VGRWRAARDRGAVASRSRHECYSPAYARGIDALHVAYQYLDIVPKGRDDRDRGPYWVKRHDEYAGSDGSCCH